MEVDTGAAVTVISAETYKTFWAGAPPPLRESATVLRAYGGRMITVLGTAKVNVQGADEFTQKQLYRVACSSRQWAKPTGARLATQYTSGLEVV